jgi:two-component system, chemotaxis family, protein-glutamate methylesterase/glutaminase
MVYTGNRGGRASSRGERVSNEKFNTEAQFGALTRVHVNRHDMIAVGASAGGVPALQRLVSALPADLAASVFVTLHTTPWHKSNLDSILTQAGPLRAVFPSLNEPIVPGRIYVAPPDHHMIVEDSRVQLWRGPKENRHRPSINTMLRSVAVEHRDRAVGVILSGCLDDGSAGLWWIKRYGGVTIVQDPLEAAYPDMVQSAMQYVNVDYVLRLSEIGALLAALAAGGDGPYSAAR